MTRLAPVATCLLLAACSDPMVTADNLAKAYSSDPAGAVKLYGQAKINVVGKVEAIDATGSRVTLFTTSRSPAVVLDNPPATSVGARVDLTCTSTVLAGANVHVAGCTAGS